MGMREFYGFKTSEEGLPMFNVVDLSNVGGAFKNQFEATYQLCVAKDFGN
jgi:hypothetical protein